MLFPFHFCFYSIFNLHFLHHSAQCCESGLFSGPGGVVIVECAVFLSSWLQAGWEAYAVSSGKTQEMAQVLQISPLKSLFVVNIEPWNFGRTAFLMQSVLARFKDFGFCQGDTEKCPGSGSEQMKLELLIHLTPNHLLLLLQY